MDNKKINKWTKIPLAKWWNGVNLILGILVILCLFTVMGCSKKENTVTESVKKVKKSSKFDTKANVDELYFKYISTNKLGDTANGKIMQAKEYNIIYINTIMEEQHIVTF